MDPIVTGTVAGLGTLLGMTKDGLDIGTTAYGLLRQVREGREAPEEADAHLLRVALLAVDRNLVLLQGINTRVEKDHEPALLSVAGAMDVAPLAALLVNWQVPADEPELPSRPGRADYERWEQSLDKRQSQTQLLAHARYIVARTSGLRALSAIDGKARKKLRLGLRLRNLELAHVRVRHLLSNEETLSHLIGRRDNARPGPPAT